MGQSVAALESLSSLVLGSKYPVNFAVPNSSSATKIEDSINGPFTPETDLEAVTLKIVELGVELRRGRMIREVLIHLRGALQSVHPLSFEFVLRALLRASEAQITSAQLESLALDLDEETTASTSSTANLYARFYWEILRMVLDISRNNSRLESVYHEAALAAFQFCRQFGRKSEFRRLSEMIRYHLALSVKYPGQQNAVPLATSTESHQMALELRFNQLTLACDMELWQEAFKTVEDIYGLQILARKSVRKLTAPEYFDKLARIFAKSDNFLFLAATLLRQPQLDPEQEETLLMATLAVPIETCGDAMQSERLAQIIGLSSVPTRVSLLKAIKQRGLLAKATGPLKALHEALEKGNVSAGVEALKACDPVKIKPFIRGCYENLLSTLIGGIVKTRDSVSLKELKDLAAVETVKSSGLLPKFNLELFLLRSGIKGIKICHQSGEIKIDRSVLLANPVLFEQVDPSMTWSHIQTEMHKILGSKTPVTTVIPENLGSLLKAEHEANLERKNRIEKRKEQLEAAAAEKERQEARERAMKVQQEAEVERLRQAEEIARRDQERLEKERAEIRRLEAEKRQAEQEKMKEAAGARLNREKIAAQANRFDYLERALRAEEIPLLEADYSKQKETDRAAYDARCALMLEVARAKFARDIEMKRKFTQSTAFESDYAAFFAGVRSRRESEFELRSAEAQKTLEAEKEKRRARIAAEMENRRRIEAERAAACAPVNVNASISESTESTSGKYVPPSRAAGSAGTWRRTEFAAPVNAAANESPSTVNAAANESPSTVTPAATPAPEEPKKNVFVPRHKRQGN